MTPLLSLIVPVYFNRDTLKELYALIINTFKNSAAFNEMEIVFVDDGSLDDSFELLCELAEKDPNRVKVIRMSRNFGSHAAILAGLTHCRGRYAAVIGADLQDSPEIVLRMLEKAQSGNYEVILACREARKEGWPKVAFANLYYFIMRKFSNAKFPPGGFDCYLIERKVINAITTLREANTSLPAQILWMGFRQASIEYTKQNRVIGKSRWTIRKKIRLLLDSLVSFSHAPIHLMHILGFLTAALGFLYATFIVIYRIAKGHQVEGWASLMVVVLLFSGIILICLGIVGEYLWRTLDAARGRPVFLIAEMVNFQEKEENIPARSLYAK